MAVGSSIRDSLRQRMIQTDRQLQVELQAVAAEYAGLLRGKHEAVVRDWVHRPRFRDSTYVSKRQVLSIVTPVGQYKKLYQWVDQGTAAHIIRPKQRGGRLTFRVGYRARTAPVAQFNVGTGRAVGGWRRARLIRHPGTKARQFSKTFNRDILPDLRRGITNAIRRALRRAAKG